MSCEFDKLLEAVEESHGEMQACPCQSIEGGEVRWDRGTSNGFKFDERQRTLLIAQQGPDLKQQSSAPSAFFIIPLHKLLLISINSGGLLNPPEKSTTTTAAALLLATV